MQRPREQRRERDPDDRQRRRRRRSGRWRASSGPTLDPGADEQRPRAEPDRRAAASGMRSGNRDLVAVRERVRRRPARPAPTSANAAATTADDDRERAPTPRSCSTIDEKCEHDSGRRDDAQRGEAPRSRREQRDQSERPRRPQQDRGATRAGPSTIRRARRRARPGRTGRSAQVARAHHSETTVRSASSTCNRRPILRIFMPDTVLVARNGHCDRQPSASRRAAPRPRSCCAAFPSCRRAAAPDAHSARGVRRAVGRVRSPASTSHDDGAIELTPRARLRSASCIDTTFDADRARRAARRSSTSRPRSREPPRRVKVQMRRAAHARRRVRRSGHADVDAAFPLGARAARRVGRRARSARRRRGCPNAALVCSASTSPRSCAGATRKARSTASSRPTFCRPRSPRPTCLTAVHVCGRGDLRLALDAGPRLVHFDVGALDLDDAVDALPLPRRRRLGRSWGAIPTRPAGRRARRSRSGRRSSTCGAS